MKSRRTFVRNCLAGVTVPLAMGDRALGAGKRPNILYIHSHDSGRYLQPFGHAVPAPNLQRLAESGVLFRMAFNAGPTCSPSRASLLTGQCPHSNGMLGLAHRGFVLKDYKHHMLHTLRSGAGYYSAQIGVQHITSDAAITGYDFVGKTTGGSHCAQVVPVALDFLQKAPKQPFFLDAGFFETHRPYEKPGPSEDPRFCIPPAPIPDTPQTRLDMASFKASARVLDQAVGDILKALESAGLADNTLVISTTDHGIAFPAMKCNLTDHGMGVSLIMHGPGGFAGGKVCDAMVSHIDVFPTLCDLLDIEKPKWLEGKSMMPLIRGDAKEINEEIFGEINYHAAYEPKRAVRTHRWKYIRAYDDRGRTNLPNCDDGLSKTLWLDNGWGQRKVDAEQLYDLMFDPNETRNVAADQAARPALEEMRGRLDRWMHATNDPALHGPVKAPPGAVVNDPNGTSPHEKTQPAG